MMQELKTLMIDSIPFMIKGLQESLTGIEDNVRQAVDSVPTENMQKNVTPFVELWGYTFGSVLLV